MSFAGGIMGTFRRAGGLVSIPRHFGRGDQRCAMTPTHPIPPDEIQPADNDAPIFDRAQEDLPWQPEDALPMDDDGNILPGNDTMDDDPNDNGDMEHNDPDDTILSPI